MGENTNYMPLKVTFIGKVQRFINKNLRSSAVCISLRKVSFDSVTSLARVIRNWSKLTFLLRRIKMNKNYLKIVPKVWIHVLLRHTMPYSISITKSVKKPKNFLTNMSIWMEIYVIKSTNFLRWNRWDVILWYKSLQPTLDFWAVYLEFIAVVPT